MTFRLSRSEVPLHAISHLQAQVVTVNQTPVCFNLFPVDRGKTNCCCLSFFDVDVLFIVFLLFVFQVPEISRTTTNDTDGSEYKQGSSLPSGLVTLNWTEQIGRWELFDSRHVAGSTHREHLRARTRHRTTRGQSERFYTTQHWSNFFYCICWSLCCGCGCCCCSSSHSSELNKKGEHERHDF